LNITDGYGELMYRNADTGAIVLAARFPTGATELNSIDWFKGYLNCYGGETRYTPPIVATGANATFPLGAAPTVANPTAPSAAQTGTNEVTVTLSDREKSFTRKIERQKNGGAWTTLQSAYTAATLIDTDLVATDVVKYRDTAQINAFSSSAVESNSVTVSSGATFVADDHYEDTTGTPPGYSITIFGGVDFDYDGDPLTGSVESLQLGGVSDPASVTRTLDADVSSGWAKFRFRVDVEPTNFNYFFQMLGVSADVVLQIVRLADGTVGVLDKDGFGLAATTGTVDIGVEYYGWAKWVPETTPGAHDMVGRVCFNTVDVMPTSGANFAQFTNGRVSEDTRYARLNVAADRGTWVFDDLQVSGSAFA
jgi:hypothetical protein